ncbi:hypothetical protein ACT3TC_13295 [Halomonas sp. AOP27-A1-41]|uniref:hypothetical protein n=1 Tax=Halomonas sp. AOP27-A1-41 TaxID=3457707 RepID=UPI0040332E1A
MSESLLRKAQDGLSLLDIQMHRFDGWVSEDYEPRASSDDSGIAFQTKKLVKSTSLLEITGSEVEATYIFRVDIDLGVRYTEPVSGDEEAEPCLLAQIEASYYIDYTIQAVDLKDNIDALEEFATKNSPHHVWSFWREYVDSQTSRMRLPKFLLPMVPRINDD